MKKLAKWFLVSGLVMIVLLCFPAIVHAQVTDPNCDPMDPFCPIDGGISILLAAGIGYGIKKVKNLQKSSSSANSLK